MSNQRSQSIGRRAVDAERRDPMSDEAAEAALHFLLTAAAEAGKVRAQIAYFDDFRKVVLARLKREAPPDCRSDAARDDWARTQQDYQDVLTARYAATERYEELLWHRTHAEATLESWRTKSANTRGAGRMT